MEEQRVRGAGEERTSESLAPRFASFEEQQETALEVYRMRSNGWYIGVGVAVGGGTAFLLLKLVQLFLLYAGDTAPRLPQRWTPAINVAGTVASGIFGLAVLLFVARSASGPALLRRVGIALGTVGLALVSGGTALSFMPHRPPIHPGRMPAGDVAAGTIAYFVFLTGVVVAAAAILTVMGGLGWSWLRRRKEAAAGAS